MGQYYFPPLIGMREGNTWSTRRWFPYFCIMMWSVVLLTTILCYVQASQKLAPAAQTILDVQQQTKDGISRNVARNTSGREQIVRPKRLTTQKVTAPPKNSQPLPKEDLILGTEPLALGLAACNVALLCWLAATRIK